MPPALGVLRLLWKEGKALVMLRMRLPWACLGLVVGREGLMMLMMHLPWACRSLWREGRS